LGPASCKIGDRACARCGIAHHDHDHHYNHDYDHYNNDDDYATADTVSCVATVTEEIADAYGLVRALLTDRGPHDRGKVSAATESILLHTHETKLSQLWGAMADEAEYHHVAPLLEPMVTDLARKARPAIPDDVRRVFLALASRHRRAALAREMCIDQLLQAFATGGISTILLKGAVLAHRIYPSPAVRPMVDIDVLIDPADSERVINLVMGLGYSFASEHGSRFAGRMHHLPVATRTQSGFRISLEIHLNTMSSNQTDSLTFATLTAKPEPFCRGSGPVGLALGHTDMLRHLTHHAFEPSRRLRLIHLYDLWRYKMIFHNEIDWYRLAARFPEVTNILRLVSYVFASPRAVNRPIGAASEHVPAGVGLGMVPLSEIATADLGLVAKLTALLNPPAWWLHGFYGIPPEKSLLVCRTVRHPATVVRWLVKRLAAGIRASAPAAAH
jgi:hypothetical protein